jgi:hypothetical protein
MGTTSNPSKAATLARVQALGAGTLKRFPNGQFTLGKKSFTTASLVALFQSVADAMLALNDAQAKAKDALKALQGAEANASPVIRDYVRFLRATFGTATSDLAEFGLEPDKARRPLTSEERLAATEKLRATRKARGTKGRRERLLVKGNVTGVVVTPVTTA